MFENLKFEMGDKKIYLYSVGIGMCLLSVFGVIILASAGTERIENTLPSPSPAAFGEILGAKTPSENQMIPPPPQNVGPQMPSSKPSPVPSPSPSSSPPPSPSPSPVESSSPSPSPSPSPSQSSNNDTSGPDFRDFEVANIESNKVTIKWKTNEEADELVIYWKESGSENDKKVKESTDRKMDHSIELTGLDANTSYKYKITGKDSHNNSATSEEKTFKTS